MKKWRDLNTVWSRCICVSMFEQQLWIFSGQVLVMIKTLQKHFSLIWGQFNSKQEKIKLQQDCSSVKYTQNNDAYFITSFLDWHSDQSAATQTHEQQTVQTPVNNPAFNVSHADSCLTNQLQVQEWEQLTGGFHYMFSSSRLVGDKKFSSQYK